MPQHIEFIHTDHFEKFYHRKKAPASLSLFIDFFWETNFDTLWPANPDGFSDVLFPNTGYTYLINLGTPFVMQVADKKFPMKTDGFLPRHKAIECYHKPGNCIFGIKFKTSPIIFEKKINFSEYRESIFPLSYLADATTIKKAKAADSFVERVKLMSDYFDRLVTQYSGPLLPVQIVTEILSDCERNNDFGRPVEELAAAHHISTRTLQRYFETYTGISTKKVLQIMRVRKAVELLVTEPDRFNLMDFGYYDHSHFYKHLKQFLQKSTLQKLQPHLPLLAKLHR
ncbi:MAG: helix-turn-helix domain-containing protein [Bacteroidota bacterium]